MPREAESLRDLREAVESRSRTFPSVRSGPERQPRESAGPTRAAGPVPRPSVPPRSTEAVRGAGRTVCRESRQEDRRQRGRGPRGYVAARSDRVSAASASPGATKPPVVFPGSAAEAGGAEPRELKQRDLSGSAPKRKEHSGPKPARDRVPFPLPFSSVGAVDPFPPAVPRHPGRPERRRPSHRRGILHETSGWRRQRRPGARRSPPGPDRPWYPASCRSLPSNLGSVAPALPGPQRLVRCAGPRAAWRCGRVDWRVFPPRRGSPAFS